MRWRLDWKEAHVRALSTLNGTVVFNSKSRAKPFIKNLRRGGVKHKTCTYVRAIESPEWGSMAWHDRGSSKNRTKFYEPQRVKNQRHKTIIKPTNESQCPVYCTFGEEEKSMRVILRTKWRRRIAKTIVGFGLFSKPRTAFIGRPSKWQNIHVDCPKALVKVL